MSVNNCEVGWNGFLTPPPNSSEFWVLKLPNEKVKLLGREKAENGQYYWSFNKNKTKKLDKAKEWVLDSVHDEAQEILDFVSKIRK